MPARTLPRISLKAKPSAKPVKPRPATSAEILIPIVPRPVRTPSTRRAISPARSASLRISLGIGQRTLRTIFRNTMLAIQNAQKTRNPMRILGANAAACRKTSSRMLKSLVMLRSICASSYTTFQCRRVAKQSGLSRARASEPMAIHKGSAGVRAIFSPQCCSGTT